MPEVRLRVTRAVLNHLVNGQPDEQQIAVRTSSPELLARLTQIDGQSPRTFGIGGCISPVMGDTGAIWRKHSQDDGEPLEEKMLRLTAPLDAAIAANLKELGYGC